jgi:hypothetical protein
MIQVTAYSTLERDGVGQPLPPVRVSVEDFERDSASEVKVDEAKPNDA